MKFIKKYKKIFICLLLSLLTAFITEIFVFNYNSIFYSTYNEKAKVENVKGAIKKNNCFYIKDNTAIIDIKTKKDYINKISFDYETKNSFQFYIKTNKKTRIYNSSELFKKATKKIKNKSKKIQLIVPTADIKICNIRINNEFLLNEYRLVIQFLIYFLILIIISYRKYFKENLNVLGLISGLIIGVSIIISTPICLNTSADDEVHFKNSYLLLEKDKTKWSISENYFDFLVIGNAYKFKTYEEIKMYNKYLNDNYNDKTSVSIINNNNRLTYNKIVYLPLAMGLKVSKIFHLKFTHMIYFSKFLNLLFYLIILYYALKNATKYKKIIFYIGMIPTNLYLASQFSYDPTITASLLLAFTSFIKINESDKINKKQIIIFILSIVWAGLIKVFYVPILLLLLTIKKEKFDNSKQSKVFKFSVILLMLVILSNLVMPVLLKEVSGDTRIVGTSVSLQLKYIFENPFRYFCILLSMTINNFFKLFFGYRALNEFGYLLTFDNFYIKFIYFVNLFGFIITIITNNEENKLNKKQKVLSLLIVLAVWSLICTALYLDWTPVGSNVILGVNARYFLPLLIYFIVPFTFNNKRIEQFLKKISNVFIVVLFVNFIDILFLLVSYFS